MTSMFKKPKKNLRQRAAVSDDEAEAEPIKEEPKAATIKKKTSTLSFQEDLEEDEGVETFQVRKSSQSRRIAKRMERDRKMKELNKQTTVTNEVPQTTDTITKTSNQATQKEDDEKAKDLILSGREAEMAGYESESEDEASSDCVEGVKFRKPDPFRNVLESGSIPDAAMIHAARKHRQQARELGGLADYIKLDEMPDYERGEDEQKPVASARLVREDDNDKSDEDEREDGRVDFSVDLQTKDRQQRREAFLAAEQEDERDMTDDEDENDWGTQQLKKAIRHRQIEAVHQEMAIQQQYVIDGSPSSSSRSPAGDVAIPSARTVSNSLGARKGPSSVPDLSKLEPLPSPQELQEKLRDRLSRLEETHRRRVSDLEKTKSDVDACKEEVQRLQLDRPRLSDRFRYFQEMRAYVDDLIDCLCTKSFEVEALQKRWVSQLGRWHRYLVDRRREDVRDEASDCAIQSVIVQTINPDKIARTAEREARRRRRRNSRKESTRHKEGLSSDEEVNEKESNSFSTERGKIVQESNQLFSDAVEDFCSLEAICGRMDEWRRRERDSYRDAYVDMFLPRLASCLVGWHLIQDTWNPLEHEVTLIKKSKWFQTLAHYDLRSENDETGSVKEHSPLVISKTIEIAVIPYITEVVKAAYDPCSTSQTNRLVKLVRTLKEEHPILAAAGNKPVQSLLAAALEKMDKAVDQDVFIPFHFAAQNPAFVNRQFWSAAKLLRNILHWHNLVEDGQLRAVAIDKLFKRYMLLPLTKTTARGSVADPETLDKVRYIAEALPKSWLGTLVPGASQLQPLVDTTMSLAQNADSTTSAGRKHVKAVVAVLQTLGAAAEAQEILTKYL